MRDGVHSVFVNLLAQKPKPIEVSRKELSTISSHFNPSLTPFDVVGLLDRVELVDELLHAIAVHVTDVAVAGVADEAEVLHLRGRVVVELVGQLPELGHLGDDLGELGVGRGRAGHVVDQ